MSERNLSLLLLDIRVSIGKILEYTARTTFESYEADSKTKDAVERNFEIIGEAASRIPDDFKKLYPSVEWRIIKDFRNFIIHEYLESIIRLSGIPFNSGCLICCRRFPI
jgi:uncharacterized protein with HEPN domain